MSETEVIGGLILIFLFGVIAGSLLSNQNSNVELTVLATGRGIGFKMSTKPCLPHYV